MSTTSTRNDLPTIEVLQPDAVIGLRTELSTGDIAAVSLLYPWSCPTSARVMQSGWEVFSVPEVPMVGDPAVVTRPELSRMFLYSYSRDAGACDG
ncbi:M12A family metallopeptidase [Archangium lipolyticum]|uniref:hypothetical protein n=1 Tax=Archangium lipolyticum TaxID=2970465 RepID=UPI00214CC9A3|nr:hypothetical protein [Archangium lipolyticum]